MAQRLLGKVALITGGASGIGESTARLFARHGAKVVVADSQPNEVGKSVSEQIKTETGQEVTYVQCDVSVDSDVQNAVDTAVSKHGRLDIMFSNAGITGKYDPKISSIEREDFKKVFDVNVYGAFLCAKHASRVMIPQNDGCILFTSSMAAERYFGSPHPYSASKAAVLGLAKSLAVELGPHGIRVNTISPGGIPTPLTSRITGQDLRTLQETASAVTCLKGVLPDAIYVAEAALYLGSEEAKFITGVNLPVDGGFNCVGLGSNRP